MQVLLDARRPVEKSSLETLTSAAILIYDFRNIKRQLVAQVQHSNSSFRFTCNAPPHGLRRPVSHRLDSQPACWMEFELDGEVHGFK